MEPKGHYIHLNIFVKYVFSFETERESAMDRAMMSTRIRFKLGRFSILFFSLLVLSLPHALAATIHVPGISPTVQGAVNIAVAGDVVQIDDSATYIESVAITKAITLRAAPGQTPTLRYDAANPNPASYMIYCSVAGARCGSNEGGQITLDGTCNSNISVFLGSNVNSGEVIFENLKCINGQPPDQFIYPDPDPPGAGGGGNSTFTFINIIGEAAGCDAGTRFDDMDFPIRPDFLEGSTLNLINCKVTNADRMCILHGGSDIPQSFGTVNIHGCILTGRELAITNEPPSRPITWTITDTVLESTINQAESAIFGTFSPWWVRSSGQVIHATRTVFLESGLGRAFYPWFPGDDSTMTFDHCDFVSRNGNPIQLGPPTLPGERHLSIKNSILQSYNPTESGFSGDGAITDTDSFDNDYNNVNTGYGGLEEVIPTIMGAHDIIPPATADYVLPFAPNYNFKYTIPVLLTGDDSGGHLGSFLKPGEATTVKYWDQY
jgi:hypothetical protein